MRQKSLIVELAEVIARHWPGRDHVLRRLARALVPHPGTFIVTLLAVGAVLFAQQAGALPFRAPTLAGDSTTTISYQGRLADSNGDPVTTSGVGMQFRLYNTDAGGSSLWEESHTAVPVEDGLFHVLLGSTDPIPVSVLANNSTLWLGIKVGNDSEMRPLEQIASVPYAMIASTVADGAITTEKIADEAVTQTKLGADVSLEPPDGSITTEKLADDAITSSKLALHAGRQSSGIRTDHTIPVDSIENIGSGVAGMDAWNIRGVDGVSIATSGGDVLISASVLASAASPRTYVVYAVMDNDVVCRSVRLINTNVGTSFIACLVHDVPAGTHNFLLKHSLGHGEAVVDVYMRDRILNVIEVGK